MKFPFLMQPISMSRVSLDFLVPLVLSQLKIIRLLMDIDDPSKEITGSVKGAVAWLEHYPKWLAEVQ